MRKRTIIQIIMGLSLGAVLSGCSDIREDGPADVGREIRFTASVGSFQMKATDTAFEVGDAVGLYAETASGYVQNLRMEWNGLNLRPAEPLFWGPANKAYRFSAYYPYNPEWGGQDMAEFCVNSDQSTHALFTASDLMMASSLYEPTDEAVALEFHHILSQVIIHIDNQLDEEISEVYLSNVYGVLHADIYEYEWNYLDGVPGTIKTCPVAVNGASAWAAIIPAQEDILPAILVTTVSGKQFTCYPEQNVSFQSGYRTNAFLTLDETSISTTFSDEVIEWTDEKDLMFYENSWSVIGSMDGWNYDYWMEEVERGIYSITFEDLPFGVQFKFRRNGSWDFNYGIGEYGKPFETLDETAYSLTPGGSNITLPSGGTWTIELNAMEETATFACLEPDGSLVIWRGEFENENWSGMQDLAWGEYDWSTVQVGDVLHLDLMPTYSSDWWCIRVANGGWTALAGTQDYYEYPDGSLELTITNDMLDDLVNNGGLVLTGQGYMLWRIALVSVRQ